MCYRCEVCGAAVGPDQKRKIYRVLREDGNIERELSVCASCSAGLRSGYSLAAMLAMVGPRANRPAVLRHLPQTSAIQSSGPVTPPA